MKLLACVVGFVLVPVFATARNKETAAKVPDFSLSDVQFATVVNDVPFNKEELSGKVVVVEEWGVHCPPCLESLPELARLARSNAKKNLVVVGLEQQNSSKEQILKVLKSARVTYPVMAGGSAPGSGGSIPYVCVFNTSGKLVWNGNPNDKEFERAVRKELRASSL